MSFQVIRLRPPKIALLFLMIATLLHWLTPFGQLIIYANFILGIILCVLGFVTTLACWCLFKQHETPVCPTAKTTFIITTGFYRYSRNPMYLGVITLLMGVSVTVGTLSYYLMVLLYFIVIDRFFCPYEEAKLIGLFGTEYIFYKKEVRRWL